MTNPPVPKPPRNYLRVRGEYLHPTNFVCLGGELPPRARRILLPDTRSRSQPGTTSACAENTTSHYIELTPPGNYLRVRGEYYRGTPLGW